MRIIRQTSLFLTFLLLSILLMTMEVAAQPTTNAPATNANASLPSLVVAVDPFYPPFVSQNEKGELVGFDIDLFSAIAAEAKLDFIFLPTQFQYLLPGVATRLYDIGCSCLFITPKRQEQLNFTKPYFATGTALIVSAQNTSIQGLDDLTSEMTVSVLQNSVSEAVAHNRTSAVVVPVNNIIQALERLNAGEFAAVLADEESLLAYQQTHPNQLKSVGGLLSYFECGLAVAKSNPELATQLDAALAHVKSDGTYDKIYQRWFGKRPIPEPPTPTAVSPPAIAAAAVESNTSIVTDTSAAQTALTGNYYVQLAPTADNQPAHYQIITLAPHGLWFLSENLTTTTSSQHGLWQVNAQGAVEATLLLFAPATHASAGSVQPGQVLQKVYQMTIASEGAVTGQYTMTTYAAAAFLQSPTASPQVTETVTFTGKRVIR